MRWCMHLLTRSSSSRIIQFCISALHCAYIHKVLSSECFLVLFFLQHFPPQLFSVRSLNAIVYLFFFPAPESIWSVRVCWDMTDNNFITGRSAQGSVQMSESLSVFACTPLSKYNRISIISIIGIATQPWCLQLSMSMSKTWYNQGFKQYSILAHMTTDQPQIDIFLYINSLFRSAIILRP